MRKPSIGDAVPLGMDKENRKEVQNLTVLQEDSKESIYYLVFSETEKGGME